MSCYANYSNRSDESGGSPRGTTRLFTSRTDLFFSQAHLPRVFLSNLSFYAPNFEEVGEAYCFRVVRPCVHPSVRASRFLIMPYLMNRAC